MSTPPLPERAFEAAAGLLATPEKRSRFVLRVLAVIRGLLLVTAIAYLLALFVIASGIHWHAEKNLTLAFLSFLPLHLWLLPAPALFLVTLPFAPRLSLVYPIAAALYVAGFMDWQNTPVTRSAKTGEPTIGVLSYNRGQHQGQSLQPFKNDVKPDVIVLQESYGRAPLYARAEGYQEFSATDGIGEFVILSKYPVTDRRLIPLKAWNRQLTPAARFEIDFEGTPVAIYAVHLPTLRDILSYYRRGAFLYGIIGVPGTPLGEKRRINQEYWDERMKLGRELADIIAAEEIPCFVAGDFNMPDHGYIYHRFERILTDGHEEAGGGFGYTFPGTTGNPLTLFGPWLRLDYIFASDHWRTLRFVSEKDRPSQHRAVYGRFALRKSS